MVNLLQVVLSLCILLESPILFMQGKVYFPSSKLFVYVCPIHVRHMWWTDKNKKLSGWKVILHAKIATEPVCNYIVGCISTEAGQNDIT